MHCLQIWRTQIKHCYNWIGRVNQRPSSSRKQNVKGGNKTLPQSAEVVIIGGGAVGCSVAYHLARLGQRGVVLLERSELTAGSTWHAAGLTALYHPMPNLKKLHYYSINLYSQLEAETGQAVGFHRPGSIRLATSPTRVDEFRYQMSRQGHKDAPQKLLTPEEIEEMCPILNMDSVLSGLFNPYDGHIDPYSMTQALAVGARKYGAEIHLPVEVTGLCQGPGGSWDVEISGGEVIRARKVVNAAGFWAREVGKLTGLDLPLVPVEHQYLVTAPIQRVASLDREIPVLRHLEGSYYLRQEQDDCLLVGPYESQETMKLCADWATEGVPHGFGKELFPSDVDRLTPHLDAAMSLVPCLATANIKTVVCGPITYSPDLLPLVGPTRQHNLWLAVGFGYGIIHAGGVGLYLADWMLQAEPPWEMSELDPCRFGSWTDMSYTLSKARESYGLNNAVPYPHEERPAGRPTRRQSGLHKVLVQRGAHTSLHSGWEQPAWFCHHKQAAEYKPSFYRTNWHEEVAKEWHLVMNNVGLIDLTPFGKFYLSGPDSTRFLNRVSANYVPPSDGGRGAKACITHVLTPAGKVYGELTVTPLDRGEYLVVTGSGSELHDLRWLEEQARSGQFHVTLTNVTDDKACLGVSGPQAAHLLNKMCPSVDFNCFPFLTARQAEVCGVDVMALRISYTGELGWELYCDKVHLKRLYTGLLDAGTEFGVGDFGTLAMNSLRMEKGFRSWGADMNMDTGPLEAGLGSFVKLGKGEFIGRQAVLRAKRRGFEKLLTILELETWNLDPKGDETVWCAGKVVGNTTSGCYSYFLKAPLAYAYLPPFLTTPGTCIQVELLGELCSARVLSGPPVQTQPVRSKAK